MLAEVDWDVFVIGMEFIILAIGIGLYLGHKAPR